MTFAIEKHGDQFWLVAMDITGNRKKYLATFVGLGDDCVRTFNETLALAKMAAHAHGVSGI